MSRPTSEVIEVISHSTFKRGSIITNLGDYLASQICQSGVSCRWHGAVVAGGVPRVNMTNEVSVGVIVAAGGAYRGEPCTMGNRQLVAIQT